MMIRARIHQGRVEVGDPIPAEWEGQEVSINPLTPDDPTTDLEARLSELHALGPIEYELGEKELIANELAELNRLGLAAMNAIGGAEH